MKENSLLNPVDPVPPKLNPVDLLAEVLPNSPVLVFEPKPPIEGNDEDPNVLPKLVPKVLPVLPNTDVEGLFWPKRPVPPRADVAPNAPEMI